MFYPFIKISMKPFYQTLYKTAPAPPEKPLHQRSRSWSRFLRSQNSTKQALDNLHLLDKNTIPWLRVALAAAMGAGDHH